MATNVGYLQSDRELTGDECYTPFYAVEPILEFIPKDKVIWCPFDEEWSAFYQTFKEKGYTVIRSSLKEGQDFFDYEPDEYYDVIISNPPFSKKDEVLKRLYKLDKPFAILLPTNSIQGVQRFKLFELGIEMLCFDRRIAYHTKDNFNSYRKGVAFSSAYFCRDVLPETLELRRLNEYQKPLK